MISPGVGVIGGGDDVARRATRGRKRSPVSARDARAPFFRRHFTEDLGHGLIYREAFTTTAADAVVEHLVKDCGLTAAVEAKRPGADLKVSATSAEGSSALHDVAPGKIVFAYRSVQK